MDRRAWLMGMGAWGVSAAAQPLSSTTDLAAWARRGGVMMIRHTRTEDGIGDPPDFTLGLCRTQRNLSSAGRVQAQAIGAWFKRHGVAVDRVLTSQWCRCRDTAQLAFGASQDWPALNSTFAGQGQHDTQIQALRARLVQLTPGTLEVWVTHQVIMTGLTGAYPAMGEGFMLDRHGALQARGTMTDAA